MDYHPGGELELLRGAGTDGTTLFGEIHPWVNYESMLKSCFVGPFVGNRKKLRSAKQSAVMDSDGDSSSLTSTQSLADVGIRIVPPTKKRVLQLTTGWRDLQEDEVLVEMADGLFRVLVSRVNTQPIELAWERVPKSMEQSSYSVSVDFGSILITFDAFDDMAFLARPESCVIRVNPDRRYRRCVLGSKDRMTHDTYLCRVDLPQKLHLRVPIGHHVVLRIRSKKEMVERPYTPVVADLVDKSTGDKRAAAESLFFLIKIYEKGLFTSILDQLPEGGKLEVGDPSGAFDMSFMGMCDTLCLLAAGTGFTPMVKLIRQRLNMPVKRKTKLLLFNKTTGDIVWEEQLEQLRERGGLEVVHVLSQADTDWTGDRGRVSRSLLSRHLPSPTTSAFICVCGPDAFVQTALQFLEELGFQDSNVHVFQG